MVNCESVHLSAGSVFNENKQVASTVISKIFANVVGLSLDIQTLKSLIK